MTTENERAAIVGERIIALGNELEKYKIQWFERGRRIEDLERQLADLERQIVWRKGSQQTHYDGCWQEHKECALARIADLERQLAEATQWRSPETAPRDGGNILIRVSGKTRIGYYSGIYETWFTLEGLGCWSIDAWLPLPETKKEEA